jgi:hypothetical protein
MLDQNLGAEDHCPNCGSALEGRALQTCMICRTRFCLHCTVRGYGREFCSDTCRAMFFFGDGDDELELEKED